MPRKPNIVAGTHLHTVIPADVRTRLDLVLYSEVEGRVPHGAYQSFFLARIRDFFETQELDLAPYLGSLPGEMTVRGRKETLEIIKARLVAHSVTLRNS